MARSRRVRGSTLVSSASSRWNTNCTGAASASLRPWQQVEAALEAHDVRCRRPGSRAIDRPSATTYRWRRGRSARERAGRRTLARPGTTRRRQPASAVPTRGCARRAPGRPAGSRRPVTRSLRRRTRTAGRRPGRQRVRVELQPAELEQLATKVQAEPELLVEANAAGAKAVEPNVPAEIGDGLRETSSATPRSRCQRRRSGTAARYTQIQKHRPAAPRCGGSVASGDRARLADVATARPGSSARAATTGQVAQARRGQLRPRSRPGPPRPARSSQQLPRAWSRRRAAAAHLRADRPPARKSSQAAFRARGRAVSDARRELVHRRCFTVGRRRPPWRYRRRRAGRPRSTSRSAASWAVAASRMTVAKSRSSR